MTLPKNTFAQGEYPVATEMNKFSTSLDAIHGILGDSAVNLATIAGISSAVFTMVHTARYLWFRSTGLLVDPAGIEDAISLSDPDRPTRYDLDQVSWLVYGATYYVTGCAWCAESET
jgi:hypothetical protein